MGEFENACRWPEAGQQTTQRPLDAGGYRFGAAIWRVFRMLPATALLEGTILVPALHWDWQ